MTWQLTLALKGGLQRYLDAEVKAGRRSVYGVVNTRKNSLKNKLRKQVRAATKSQRLANTIRDWINPEKEFAVEITAYVFSKALYKRRHGLTDLIQVLDKGATIFAQGSKLLAIPIDSRLTRGRGVRGNRKTKSPSDFPEGTFVFRPRKKGGGGGYLFWADRPDEIAFVLVHYVRLHKKIDIDRDYQAEIGRAHV